MRNGKTKAARRMRHALRPCVDAASRSRLTHDAAHDAKVRVTQGEQKPSVLDKRVTEASKSKHHCVFLTGHTPKYRPRIPVPCPSAFLPPFHTTCASAHTYAKVTAHQKGSHVCLWLCLH